MDAFYREVPGTAWQACEIVATHPRGLVIREVGRPLPGIMLADWSQVRVASTPRLSPDEIAIWREQERA